MPAMLADHCGLGHTKGGHSPQDVLTGLVLASQRLHARHARLDRPVVLSSGALRQSYSKHVAGANPSLSVNSSNLKRLPQMPAMRAL
jgi:hypothetical protein